MKALPGEFLSRMQAELKGDYAAFLESYNNESVRGLRGEYAQRERGCNCRALPR